jgi:hypothetical protein|tara:strand:- start:2526 stop:4607 length:2082 start_codon:yes stop_codon:yes gene_type:complete
MTTLTGTKIANTYGGLLKVSSTGVTGVLQNVQDGLGNNSAIQLSNSTFNISGNWQLGGTGITADASAINAITDLTGITGYIAMAGGTPYGREFQATSPMTITNGAGQAGNSTIALAISGVTSATYGPMHTYNIDRYGLVVSAAVTTHVSVGTISATTMYLSNDLTALNGHFGNTVSAVAGFYGDLTGDVTGDVVGDVTGDVIGDVTGDLTGDVTGDVTGNITGNVTGDIDGAGGSFSTGISSTNVVGVSAKFTDRVSAGFFYGDGRHLVNVPSAAGGTMNALEAGTGIKMTVDGVVTTTGNISATIAVSSDITLDSLTLEGTGESLFVEYNARINGHTSAADATFSGNVTATAYWGDGSNLTNVSASSSVTSFTANNLGVVVKASITDSYIGRVSGSSAHFTAEVCASEYYGDGSNLTNLPTAPSSVTAFTVNQLTVVSSSILVSATADSLVVSGNVSATAYYGSGANLTDIVLPTSGTDLKVNNLNVGVMTSTTALTVGAIASIGTDLVVGGDIYVSGGSIEIKTDSGSPALIDLYCETGNAHYTRLQAPTHAALVGGSIIATMPVSSTQLAGVSTTDIFTTKTFADQTNFSTGITVVGNVTAAAYWGDGANLTNVPAATSANIFTVNQLNVVTIASVTRLAVGTVSVTGQVSGVGMTLSGNVTAAAYWGSGSNLTGIATTDEIIALAIALG